MGSSLQPISFLFPLLTPSRLTPAPRHVWIMAPIAITICYHYIHIDAMIEELVQVVACLWFFLGTLYGQDQCWMLCLLGFWRGKTPEEGISMCVRDLQPTRNKLIDAFTHTPIQWRTQTGSEGSRLYSATAP